MKKAGILGWPVHHSLSPRLHAYWLNLYGIKGTYEPFAVEPKDLESTLHSLPDRGFRGVNLTMPHKEAALDFVDHVDESLRRDIGAINTIIVRDDGTLEGRNTDIFGFSENLRTAGCTMAGKRAVVLGGGGAGQAALYALSKEGCSEVRLISTKQAQKQRVSLVQVQGWDNLKPVLEKTDILINATSLGMTGQPPLRDELMSNLSALPDDAWVTDMVYAPLLTDLLKQAQQRNLRTVDGLGMLLHQARPAFQAWFGPDPEVTQTLRDFVLTPPPSPVIPENFAQSQNPD